MLWEQADHANTVGTVGFQELEEVPMSIVGAFDLHPRQLTYDYLGLDPKSPYGQVLMYSHTVCCACSTPPHWTTSFDTVAMRLVVPGELA